MEHIGTNKVKCIYSSNKSPTRCNNFFQFIILTFIYSSTCFGRFPAHNQELNDCSGSLWFYLRIMVTVVLCSWSGRQDNKLKKKIVASGWWFIWTVRWCTDLQTLNCIYSMRYLSHRYWYLPLSWKSLNWFECAVGGHPQHTQTSSNTSTILADSNNGVTNTRCCGYSCLRSWWWVMVPPETCRAVSR